MKKLFGLFAAAAAAFAAMAAPAAASTINLSGASSVATNVSNDNVDQVGLAVNINIGEQLNSLVDQSVLLGNNLNITDVTTRQDATGVISGNLAVTGVVGANLSVAPVLQIAGALNGGADLTNTDVSQAVTALNNANIGTVLTVQK